MDKADSAVIIAGSGVGGGQRGYGEGKWWWKKINSNKSLLTLKS